jgi:hypothetical protein
LRIGRRRRRRRGRRKFQRNFYSAHIEGEGERTCEKKQKRI